MARETAESTDQVAPRPDDGELALLRRQLETERAEKQALGARLAEAREQQTATGAILRVIGASPADARPVFDAIVEEAVRVCGAVAAMLWRVDGAALESLALHVVESWPRVEGPLPPGTRAPRVRDALLHERGSGRAVLERRAVQLVDGQVGPEEEFATLCGAGAETADSRAAAGGAVQITCPATGVQL